MEGFYHVGHYQRFRRYIFGDIYPWAGEFRTINIIRTTITFLSQFAKYRGIPLDSTLFVKHGGYMRNALVASVFEDEILGKKRNFKYLERILKDAMAKSDN